MRFDTAEFLYFFAVVLLLHRFLPRQRLLLICSSYLFYASWNPPFLLLLLFSTALDFYVARRLEQTEGKQRKLLLGLSLCGNLGVLAYFKYASFFLAPLGFGSAETLIPLGISFYTFQTLSYTIDVYRGRATAHKSLIDFALFVSFFPQLIAGPILRASEFLPQIKRDRRATTTQVLEGIELCLVGLFKKIVIADTFAQLVDATFGNPDQFSGGALLLGSFAFSCQIYCDFSGYSTMARGLAKLLGYELPRNFDFPLLAKDPVAYRRGWHITMGRWFSDYLYRPLGGDRCGPSRMAFNTTITWMAFGLWHGANWTFVLWGALNGLLLTGYRLLRHYNLWRLPSLLGYLVMPIFISLTTIAFRAPDVDTAVGMVGRIVSWSNGSDEISAYWGIGLAVLYGVHWLNKLFLPEGFISRSRWPVRILWFIGMILVLMLFAGSGQPFYYFQF